MPTGLYVPRMRAVHAVCTAPYTACGAHIAVCAPHAVCVYRGTSGDNGRVESQLEALTNPVLLWTGGGTGAGDDDAAGTGEATAGAGAAAAAGTAATAAGTAAAAGAATAAAVDDDNINDGPHDSLPHDYIPHDYVVLDGTWQEAKSIYRKGPACLR